MAVVDFEVIYALRSDSNTIAAIQRATLTTESFGLEPEPALFGTPEWWRSIDEGDWPVEVMDGVISTVSWGSMRDWPEFELMTTDGAKSTWTRQGDITRYVEGLRVRLTATIQRHRSGAQLPARMDDSTMKVIEIQVERSLLRSSRYAPGPMFEVEPWRSDDYIDAVRAAMSRKGARTAAGLTDAEVAGVEREFGFVFPPDLRYLLQQFVPLSAQFPDWRGGDPALLRSMLDWPADGICWDIEHNDFWLERWGSKPADLYDAIDLARVQLRAEPVLVPIFIHRFIPTEPLGDGNPVLSVYQTDIVVYGSDLPTYFANEFGLKVPVWAISRPRDIRFWGDLID